MSAAGFPAAAQLSSNQPAQSEHPQLTPPPSSMGIFPLAQVHRGLHGTAWTVFEGTQPEPMDVEILGVLRGARGPGQDLILSRLHGTKPEYTGVVAGMSGSPVYIDGKLAGALSYRIGQFSKEPIAGITPIQQMLEVRDMPLQPSTERGASTATVHAGEQDASGMTFSAMETPLVMSGFDADAIRLWKQQVAGTGLEMVSTGGLADLADSTSSSAIASTPAKSGSNDSQGNDPQGSSRILPGSAVSLQFVRGDLEIAATCTVTYVDPRQLLACGHPVQQSGSISMPMTETEVVATLASPLNAFKIVNTGRTIGAFTEDRDAAIRGEFGVQARMIPVTISVDSPSSAGSAAFTRHIEVVDLPSLTPSAVLVSVYQSLLQTNQSAAKMSYHVTGEIDVAGMKPIPVDAWGVPGEQMVPQLQAAMGVLDAFNRLYTNASRIEPMQSVRLRIEAIPADRRVELQSVRLVSSSIVHAGDEVMIEATLRPWEQPVRNVRLALKLPQTLEPGNLRLLIGGGVNLDRTLEGMRPGTKSASVDAVADRLRTLHAADRLYVSFLLPDSAASTEGRTLGNLPLSMANSMESAGSGAEFGFNGETLSIAADANVGGVLSGQQLLSLRVESGSGSH